MTAAQRKFLSLPEEDDDDEKEEKKKYRNKTDSFPSETEGEEEVSYILSSKKRNERLEYQSIKKNER